MSVFGGAIEFIVDLGIYDIVLPFLLVFAIVFAILEKTKVLGSDEIEGKSYTKKNLNAIVAFVVALLVVGSTRLVAAINDFMANIVLLLLLVVFFLVLVGVFFKEGEGGFLEKGGWKTTWMVIAFVGIVLIFFNSLRTKSGERWLIYAWDYLGDNWGAEWIGSLILLVIVILLIIYVTRDHKGAPKEAEKKEAAEK